MKFSVGVQILGKTLLPVTALFLITILIPVMRTSPVPDQLVFIHQRCRNGVYPGEQDRVTRLPVDAYDLWQPGWLFLHRC